MKKVVSFLKRVRRNVAIDIDHRGHKGYLIIRTKVAKVAKMEKVAKVAKMEKVAKVAKWHKWH